MKSLRSPMSPPDTTPAPETCNGLQTERPPVNATGGEIAAQAEAALLAAISGGQPTLPDGPSTGRPVVQAPGMVQSVNLFDLMNPDGDHTAPASALRSIRIPSSGVFVIPFTADAVRVSAHYCDDPDVNDWVLCWGSPEECALCAISRKAEQRLLLPVFDCEQGEVGVLAMSSLMRPKALAPQVFQAIAEASRRGPQIISITKPDQMSFSVASWSIPPGVDDGRTAIAKFVQDREQGLVRLDSVYLTLPNETLRALPQVARKLALRGLA